MCNAKSRFPEKSILPAIAQVESDLVMKLPLPYTEIEAITRGVEARLKARRPVFDRFKCIISSISFGKKSFWNDNPSRPFCSERCRSIDFGSWASEEYSVAGEKVPQPEVETDNY